MKEEDKNLENLIEKMMAENTLQSPSADFTSNLMSQILVAEKAKIKPYKPLISITTWVFIGVALAILIVYNVFFAGTQNNLEIGKSYTDKISAVISGIHISKTLLYAILIVPFMALVQIGVLKNYFDKKFNL
ncbi:hypothetical protein HNP37_000767 [Flavobacterium nitrogenifigens]|uniref:Uncharacterized protein n=2 Tax=Flavobacterium TaxID=237 RepID=A0A7W7IUT9_9FLAO|nr:MULTISPECIES: hypothetical protein [Flavobacterium]MBB4800728.1 hypothetical protein [Flavobacterium nitrogenifigens]MBB6385525.1 hypothetical protein [Flavobacterium notoginsengisoli]